MFDVSFTGTTERNQRTMADGVDEIFGDSDSEAEFDGFTAEDLVEVNEGSLQTFDIPDLDTDSDVASDLRLGWIRETSDPVIHEFTGQVGLNINIAQQTPINFLKLFLSDDVFQTQSEMELFISLVILTGLIEKPFLEKYWSTDALISTPIFSKSMPRDRFLNILTCFHLNNNENQVNRGSDGYDPLFKIKPLYDVTRQKCLSVYTPEEHLSLDEGMVPWRGRLSFKQYIPSKPDKFGMKLYVLCEGNSGYISTYEVYTGKSFDPNPDADQHEQAQGHTYNVVMGLMKKCGFLNKGYTLYTDNYYTSPTLYKDLDDQGTNAVGTVRVNRKEMPAAVKNSKLKKGDLIYRQRNNMVAMKWKDKRDVCMLSTKHRATLSLTQKMDRTTGEPIVIPTCIIEYNKYMGGVDRADQLAKYYTRKSLKWWKND